MMELDIENGQVNIKKHVVKSVDNLFVRFNEQQDLSGFYERSKKVGDEDYVMQQLQEFCEHELRLYLTAFKSPSRLRLKLSRFFPHSYKKWLYRYNERDLLFALHTLRSEQNRETAVCGIEHLLGLD